MKKVLKYIVEKSKNGTPFVISVKRIRNHLGIKGNDYSFTNFMWRSLKRLEEVGLLVDYESNGIYQYVLSDTFIDLLNLDNDTLKERVIPLSTKSYIINNNLCDIVETYIRNKDI